MINLDSITSEVVTNIIESLNDRSKWVCKYFSNPDTFELVFVETGKSLNIQKTTLGHFVFFSSILVNSRLTEVGGLEKLVDSAQKLAVQYHQEMQEIRLEQFVEPFCSPTLSR